MLFTLYISAGLRIGEISSDRIVPFAVSCVVVLTDRCEQLAERPYHIARASAIATQIYYKVLVACSPVFLRIYLDITLHHIKITGVGRFCIIHHRLDPKADRVLIYFLPLEIADIYALIDDLKRSFQSVIVIAHFRERHGTFFTVVADKADLHSITAYASCKHCIVESRIILISKAHHILCFTCRCCFDGVFPVPARDDGSVMYPCLGKRAVRLNVHCGDPSI